MMLVLWEDGACESTAGHERCGGAVSVEDIDGKLLEDAVFADELRDAINEALAHLEPVEATVLKMLFGVGMQVDHPPQEIAAHLRVAESRVTEIEVRALSKLRSGIVAVPLWAMAAEAI